MASAKAKPLSLITGGAGFLGSHITDFLLAKGHSVIGMDNLITGNLANIAHLKGNPDYRFVKHDVTKYIDLADDIDFIFHFASPASPIDYLELPIQTLKVGALGTHNALGLAKAKKARLLLASTSEVYGDPLVHPQTEDYWGNVNPIGPRGVYDEAKRFAESITMAYHRYHGVETRIVRIFNTYGPPDASERRTRRAGLRNPGTEKRADHRVWRWQPDPELLLHGRPDRRHLCLVAEQ
jgi:dTDP-glucose 4,6-dehydratase